MRPGPDAPDRTPGARLGAFVRRLERFGRDDLRMFAARPADRAAYDRARGLAAIAARTSGRTAMVEEARGAMREWAFRVYAEGQYQPTMVGLNWGRSLGSVDDRVLVAAALEDAAEAVLLADVLDPDALAELLGPFAEFATDP